MELSLWQYITHTRTFRHIHTHIHLKTKYKVISQITLTPKLIISGRTYRQTSHKDKRGIPTLGPEIGFCTVQARCPDKNLTYARKWLMALSRLQSMMPKLWNTRTSHDLYGTNCDMMDVRDQTARPKITLSGAIFNRSNSRFFKLEKVFWLADLRLFVHFGILNFPLSVKYKNSQQKRLLVKQKNSTQCCEAEFKDWRTASFYLVIEQDTLFPDLCKYPIPILLFSRYMPLKSAVYTNRSQYGCLL